MDTEVLLDKTGRVVEKKESWEPEDDSIEYEVMFVIPFGTTEQPDEHFCSVAVHTNDRKMFTQFNVGKEYSLKFLEKYGGKIQKVVGIEN